MDNFSRSQIVRKPARRSRNGLVAAQHRVAAEVGAAILARGGNAVDAAIATSFALGVVEPWMSGPGGGGAMILRRAGEDRLQAIDFSMRAPAALDPADYPIDRGLSDDLFPWPRVVEDRNALGALAVAVPGHVAGMGLAHERFATMEWDALLAPAVALARKGLTVDWYASLLIASAARELDRDPVARRVFLRDGYPVSSAWTATAQERCRLDGFADSLATIAAEGPRAFYEGDLARRIVADIQAAGGRLSREDLAGYRARIVEPLEIPFFGARIHAAPGLTAGPTLRHVAALTADDPRAVPGGAGGSAPGAPGADAYVAWAEALRTAYAERLATMGDVADDGPHRGCTTHFNVVDRAGNMVAVTQTLLSIFGSKMMLPDTGILMNNGIFWFDPEPGRPNSLGPGKRCLQNICPIVAARPDGSWFALGASGGRKILPAVAQLAAFMSAWGMDLETAFHTPRIDVSGVEIVVADAALDDSVHEALARRFAHHRFPRTVYPFAFACPSGIERDADGGNAGCTEIMSPWGDAVAEEDVEKGKWT